MNDPRKPSVLIVAPDIRMPGGVANYYASIQPFLNDNVSFFFSGKRKGEGKGGMLFRLLLDFKAFKKEIARHKYDVVLINPSLNSKALLRDRIYVSYAKSKGIKVVTFFRGWSVSMAKKIEGQRFWINPFLKSDAIITLSRQSQNVFKNLGYKPEVYLETTTVSDELLVNEPETFNKTIQPSSFTILFLSRVEKAKGIYEAIEAFRMLKTKYPYLTMIVAGHGSIMDEVKQFVKDNGIEGITFPGYVKGQEKTETLKKADVYFFPSSHDEGMPNSVLEAMSFGLPVVTRNVGGLIDFFENDKMGYITDSNDPKEFAAFIEKLIVAPEHRLNIGRFNSGFAKSRFLSSVVTKRLENIFSEVFNK